MPLQPNAAVSTLISVSPGMPEEVMPASLGLSSQTLNVSSFHGCIRNLYINHELQDFTRSQMKPGVVPGCQACRKLYCLHGICQPNAAQVGDRKPKSNDL